MKTNPLDKLGPQPDPRFAAVHESSRAAGRGVLARYRFRCAAGHEWESTGHNVLHRTWCLTGSRATKALKLLKRFRCAKGHEWEAHDGMKGTWCRRCAADRRRFTIEHAQGLAQTKGGRCLSAHDVDAQTKLTWECHRGHVWQSNYNSVQQEIGARSAPTWR